MWRDWHGIGFPIASSIKLTHLEHFIFRAISVNETKVQFKSYVWDETKLDSGAGADLDKVELEDEEIVQQVQKGVASRFYKHGRFSPTMEKGVHHFHTLISDFLNR